jgi:hypothetical protein
VSWADETIAALDHSLAALKAASASSTAEGDEGGDVDADEPEEFVLAEDQVGLEARATIAS